MHICDSENVPFPGPLHIPDEKSPSVTPTFTDSWYNRYSTQTYVTEIRGPFLAETEVCAAMDVDPPAHTQHPPRTPPGISFGKDYYAGAVAKMLLNRSDVKRKRTWSWQYKPSRLGCELTVL
ncbi:hypothetical protein BDZ89DRAFT_1080126 [Hymenopellis radicata]|nr:hypothetical protein BDZ89DRAFT_1080126 [Hymenopellis radicata]